MTGRPGSAQPSAGALQTQLEAKVAKQYAVADWLNRHLYSEFGIQIPEHASLSGIAMRLYRGSYLPATATFPTGPLALINMFHTFAYPGGLCHAPQTYRLFKSVYAYDVTSMYPSQIKSFPMPGGNIVWVDQAPRLSDPLCFGWIEAVARAPQGILPCLLPIRTVSGHRPGDTNLECIPHQRPAAGLFFSEELKAAVLAGYEVEIFGGYLFDRVDGAFTDYVDALTQKRQTHKAKGEAALATMTKQLLNGLYGRFALLDNFPKAQILGTGEDRPRGLNTVEPLMSGGAKCGNIVFTDDPMKQTVTSASLPVSIATTAYSRITMSRFKNLPDNPLLYSDTDSVILEHPLTPQLEAQHVSTTGEAGKLKFEGRWTDFMVRGPKTYAYLDSEGAPVIKAAGGTYPSLTHAGFVAPATDPDAKPLMLSRQLKPQPTWKTGTLCESEEGPRELFLPEGAAPSQLQASDEIVATPGWTPVSPKLDSYIKHPATLPQRLKLRS